MPTVRADETWLGERLPQRSQNAVRRPGPPSTEEDEGIEEMVRHSLEQHQ